LFTQIAASGQRLQTFKALRHRNFRWLWYSSTAQSMAQGMQFLILVWLVLDLTEDSASKAGLVIFLYGIPNMSFMIFGGIFADRIHRLKLLATCQALVTFLIVALGFLEITDRVEVWHVYATSFILGTVQALNMPARMAMVTDLVDREDLMNAVSLNSAVMNTGRIIGPAMGGGIIKLAGLGAALYFNAGCYFIGIVCLLFIKGISHHETARKATIAGELLVGLRYLWVTPVALSLVVIAYTFAFFGMPHMQLLPAFAKKVLDTGAAGVGLLLTASGVGSLIGSIILASLGNFQHKNWLLLGALFLFGVTLLLFAWSTWYWVSWVLLLFVGMGSMSFVTVGTAILQLTVPSDVQGRVLSLWMIGASLMYVGSLPTAVIADALSWPIAVAGGAALSLVFALWLGVWLPTIRRLQV